MFRRPASRRSIALLAAVAAAVGALLPATPARAETTQKPVAGTFTVIGRGFGHGRGMSQYGAMAAANAGQTWQQIIAFYYPNTVVSTRSNTPIRVGLAGHVGSAVRVRAEANLVATDNAGQALILPTKDAAGRTVASWEVNLPTTGSSTTATVWERTTTGLRTAYASTVTGRWNITAADGSLTALTSSGAAAGTFVGTLSGTRSGATMQPVLTTTLENYTRQVVPYESIGSWPVQALAAQAVAARTYAAWYLAHPRSSSYDICDTTSCQVFGGIGAETANSKAGVQGSAGKVITVKGAPILAEFGSSNGGRIVGSSLAYQVAKADPYEGRLYPAYNTWTARVSASTLQKAYPSAGTITGITVATRDGSGVWGGRVGTLKITGTTGSVTITADALRSLIGATVLRSSYFTLVATPAQLLRDLNGDGTSDLIERSASGQLLRRDGATGFATTTQIGTNWAGFKAVFQAEQANSDHQGDVLAVTSTGDLVLYTTGQTGALSSSGVVARGLAGYRNFVSLTGVTGASTPSILAIRTTDAVLVRFDRLTSTSYRSTPVVVTPTGWAGASLNALFGSGDFTGDGRPDLMARDTAGRLWLFAGNGAGGFGPPTQIGQGFGGFRDLSAVGDLNADGLTDVVVRAADGTTKVFPSAGARRFGAARTIASSTSMLLH